MNKCMFIGSLCKDPEVQTSANGKTFLNAQIACQRFGDGADFISITAFGKNAETISKYFTKGSKIGLETHCQTGSYDKDGHRVYTTTFVVDKIDFCEKKGTSDDGFAQADDSELPFN